MPPELLSLSRWRTRRERLDAERPALIAAALAAEHGAKQIAEVLQVSDRTVRRLDLDGVEPADVADPLHALSLWARRHATSQRQRPELIASAAAAGHPPKAIAEASGLSRRNIEALTREQRDLQEPSDSDDVPTQAEEDGHHVAEAWRQKDRDHQLAAIAVYAAALKERGAAVQATWQGHIVDMRSLVNDPEWPTIALRRELRQTRKHLVEGAFLKVSAVQLAGAGVPAPPAEPEPEGLSENESDDEAPPTFHVQPTEAQLAALAIYD